MKRSVRQPKVGDLMLFVGGPLDGERRRFEPLFPWCPELLPCAFKTAEEESIRCGGFVLPWLGIDLRGL